MVWVRMPRARPFLGMDAAPFDGTAVEVRHGPGQEVVVAHWNRRLQGWLREDDPTHHVLHRVTEWRPVKLESRRQVQRSG